MWEFRVFVSTIQFRCVILLMLLLLRWLHLLLLLFSGWDFTSVCIVGQIMCIFIVSSVWVLWWEAWAWWPSTGLCTWWPSAANTIGNFTEQSQSTAGTAEFLETKNGGQKECNLWHDQSLNCQENQTAQKQWNQSNQFCTECQQKWASNLLQFTASLFDGTGHAFGCFFWEFHLQWMRFSEICQWIHGQIEETTATFRFVSWKWIDNFIFWNCFSTTGRNWCVSVEKI